MAEAVNPIAVEVWRGPLVESRHRAAVAVADAAGAMRAARGDIEAPVYPRSAIKPLQALALIETGAAAAFSVSEEEIALASASHSGEPDHVRLGEAWLDRLGLTEGDLACGAHRPMHGASARALVQAGVAPGPLHNNCSGKHLALLTTALHLGEPVADYVAPEHPAQRRLRDIVGELAALDLEGAPRATDGCSIPTIAVPLRNLARALAQLADPAGLAPARAAAARRIIAAMAAHPYLVAGSGRYCSEVIAATGGRVLVKTGAEGVMAAIVSGLGLGVVLKVDDGARRAAEIAMSATLLEIGALDEAEAARLAALIETPVRNWRGVTTGAIRAADPGRDAAAS